MSNSFSVGNDIWEIVYVPPTSDVLIDRTGVLTLGVTDPSSMTIYVASGLSESVRRHVLLHELGHCAMYSSGLIDIIHKTVRKKYWVEVEERLCNFLADYILGAYNMLM